jgi:hypothetical protein
MRTVEESMKRGEMAEGLKREGEDWPGGLEREIGCSALLIRMRCFFLIDLMFSWSL